MQHKPSSIYVTNIYNNISLSVLLLRKYKKVTVEISKWVSRLDYTKDLSRNEKQKETYQLHGRLAKLKW